MFNNNSSNKLTFHAMGRKLDVYNGQSGSIASSSSEYPFKEMNRENPHNHIFLSHNGSTSPIKGCEIREDSPDFSNRLDASKNYYEITIDKAGKCSFIIKHFKVKVPENIINQRNNVIIHNNTDDPILAKQWWTSGIFGIRLYIPLIIESHEDGYINAPDDSVDPVIEIENNKTHKKICNKDRAPHEKCEELLKNFDNRYIIDIESSGKHYSVSKDKKDITPSVIFNNKSEQSLTTIVEQLGGFNDLNKLLNHNDSVNYLGHHHYNKLYVKNADRLISEYEIPQQCIVNGDLCRQTIYNITTTIPKNQQDQSRSEVIKKTVRDIK